MVSPDGHLAFSCDWGTALFPKPNASRSKKIRVDPGVLVRDPQNGLALNLRHTLLDRCPVDTAPHKY